MHLVAIRGKNTFSKPKLYFVHGSSLILTDNMNIEIYRDLSLPRGTWHGFTSLITPENLHDYALEIDE